MTVALELGLLQSKDGGISFSDPDVRRDYLVRHTASLALEVWDDPKSFADFFEDAEYRTLGFGTRREVTTVVLLVLANDHGKDVVGRVGQVAELGTEGEGRNRLFRNLYHPLCEALPDLVVDSRRLADALESVMQATSSDGTAGWIHVPVERLAARSRAGAEDLYETFVSRSGSPVATFVAPILVGLAKHDLKEAHRRALALTKAEQPALRKAGVGALGHFDYLGANRADLLESTWESLEAIRTEQSPERGQVLAKAYGDLLPQKHESAEALVELASHPDPATRHQVAAILSLQNDGTRGESWYRDALTNLASVPTAHSGTWQELDHCASDCAESTPDLAIAFMEAVVLGRDYGGDGERGELPEMLGGTFSELIVNNPDALEAAITRWFASEERRLHRAARDVVRHSQVHTIEGGNPWPKLSKRVLDELDEQTVVHALKRIMGHVVTGGHYIAALLLSAVRRDSCSPDFMDFVAWTLGEHVLYNFPGEAGDYLRSRIESGDVTEAEREVVRAALDHSEAYFAALRNLPELVELRVPSRRLHPLHLGRLKQQAAISEEADKRSVLASLMPTVPLKYGRGFFTEQHDGDYTEPSTLGEISHSMELPRGELIDPIGQQLKRIRWQSAGLDEEAEDSSRERPTGEAEA